MKKFIVIVPALFALGGCLQGGTSVLETCSTGSAACLQAALADMAVAPSMEASVPGENSRDGRDGDRTSASTGNGGASNAGATDGGSVGDSSSNDDNGVSGDKGKADDNDDDDGNADKSGKGDKGKAADDDDGGKHKGGKGNKGDHRNQNANEKGDNRDDKAGNADDAHS